MNFLMGANLNLTVAPFRGAANDWDSFAQSCSASFRGSYSAGWFWQFEHQILFRIRRFDIILTSKDVPLKIGQVAVGIGRRHTVFADTLQINPVYDEFWTEAMRAVLATLGPGVYVYGSEWSLEPSRTAFTRKIEGVDILQTRDTEVQAVDFSRWPDWNTYYSAVSQNAKRNVKGGLSRWPESAVKIEQGVAIFFRLLVLQFYRAKLFRRKGLGANVVALALRSFGRCIAAFRYTKIARCISAGRALAFYNGIDFGPNTFFIEAAPVAVEAGLSSYLLKEMLLIAHKRSAGVGKFVMGPDDPHLREESGWQGLMRSRQQWRATAFPTSIFRFSYSAERAA